MTSRLRELWQQFPAILLLGARQVGKTTLARRTFPDFPYYDLEEPTTRELFAHDPTFQIQQASRTSGLILDEVQSVPEVFAALRGIIDSERTRHGQFLLLGSAQPALVAQVSESLAGRVSILELDPLTAAEVGQGDPAYEWQRLWVQGGFPDALRGSHREWWEAYVRTYVERDLPYLGLRSDPLLLRRLLTMLAHGQGGIVNASDLGRSLGLSYHTVQRYLEILERTFLLQRLPPYFRNVGKRLTKSPKLYLRDTGLLHHLLNITTLEELNRHPIRGASWETFVIQDIIRRERVTHPFTQYFFWRTATGEEADLVLDRGDSRVAVEIKAGRGDRPEILRNLERASADIGATKAWIIDQGLGTTAVSATVERKGFDECVHWLP